jgi:coproporphyrinogen III oxidase
MNEIGAAMQTYVHGLQDRICDALAALDGHAFREDAWERPGGGGGRSRVLQDGAVFEKAGVNVSVVHGELAPEAARAMGGGKALGENADLSFRAVGLSLVLHPWNPMAPTTHANYRFFQRGDGMTPGAWWFGGGSDLTPNYLFEDDVRHFHATHKAACDAHDPAYYPRFKAWCDTYFRIPHRGESRGLGGIFFDDLHDKPAAELLAFVQSCGDAFLPAYLPILARTKDLPYTEEHQRWQQLRRGRYVEFNLVYDRGTTFGLRTGGRVESILMSLPLTARWEYDQHPEPGSEEARLVKVLREPVDWL